MSEEKDQLELDFEDWDINDIQIFDLKDNIDLHDTISTPSHQKGWSVDYIPNIFVSPQEIGIDIIEKIRKVNE